MGNCIGLASKKVSPDGYDQESNSPAAIAGKINSGDEALLVTGLKSGEVHHSLEVHLDKADNFQRMKIVVNKKQLELLKRRLEELKLSNVVIQSIRKKEKKWRPSLATIPEI